MSSAALLLLLWRLGAPCAGAVAVSTASFRGDDCRRCHEAIRDRVPGPLPGGAAVLDAGSFDAVVVGGGLAGLSAAYWLKDLRVLVLDKEARAGGQSRRQSLDGRLYPVGAAAAGKPAGRVHKLLRSLGLKPEPVRPPGQALHDGGKIVYDWLAEDASELPYSKAGQDSVRGLQAFLGKFASSGGIDVPLEFVKPERLAAYDQASVSRYVDNEFGAEAARLADLHARNTFGVSGEKVSAAAALFYFSSELEPRYSWEGGPGAVSEALAQALGPAISTGSFVWRVSQDEAGASVEFRREGRDWRARARAVIVAVPSLIARRIVSDLTEEKKAAMAKVRYSSFLVAPLRFSRTVWDRSFALWTPGRFFTTLSLPGLPSPEGEGQVLVAYAPLGEAEGRRLLINAGDEDLAAKVVSDLDSALPGATAALSEARVIRWAHAAPVPYPGFLTTVRPILAKSQGRYFFAGADTQLPSFEGAVYSGLIAAEAARRSLGL